MVERWASLTWDDIDRWAGVRSVGRGRTYERQGRVKDLAVTEDGRLLATVLGGQKYTVSVWLAPGAKKQGGLESKCSCPVGYSGCKHAVAVVAAYLQALADENVVATADLDDPRWTRLDEDDYDDDDDELDEWELDEDEEHEYDEDEYEDDENPRWRSEPERKATEKGPPDRRTRAEWDEAIRHHISNKGDDELRELVCSLVDRFPELREEFKERIALGEGDVARLVAQAKRELQELTSAPAWRNSWTGEGYTPDYTRLKHRMERLLELGHADAVVKLGREFIRQAMRQLDESHDEGEAAMAVAECMPVVFDAVKKSSLPGAEKILFAIDACMDDSYDVLDEAAGAFLDAEWPKSDWSAVADVLSDRLKKMPGKADREYSSTYKRERLSGWLLSALEEAGRHDELLAVYETEAREAASYERLVKYLIAEGKYEEAERWAGEGIEKTIEKWPGIASSLATELCEVARRRCQWDLVAADAAWRFFEHPGAAAFKELADCAAKAKCAKAVRSAALAFLETGKAPVGPVTVTRGKDKGQRKLHVDPAWPLPVPDYLVPLILRSGPARAAPRPHFNVLLDMAIAAKKPDDVLHWYDKMGEDATRSPSPWGLRAWREGPTADRVAAAVAKSHPERALAIYRHALQSHLPHANISAYEASAHYLKAMRPIMAALKQTKEWDALVAKIRETYRNRPRFMEILDRLDGRTIVAAKKARRKRR